MFITAAKRLLALLFLVVFAILVSHRPGTSAEPASSYPAPSAPAAAPASPNGKVPPLDEFLKRGMASHPDIEAARAKVELAEAELRQVRYRVASELTDLQNTWTSLIEEVAYKEERYRNGHLSIEELLPVRTKLAETEARAKLLLSQKPSAQPLAKAEATQAKPDIPMGPLVPKIVEVLHKTTSIEFNETPLQDVMAYLTEQHKVKFLLSLRDLEMEAISTDLPITISLENVPLGAALQAIEDTTGLCFVLRDYGIVCTTKDAQAQPGGPVSAVEYWEIAPLPSKPTSTSAEYYRPGPEPTSAK